MLNKSEEADLENKVTDIFYVTDSGKRFCRIAELFLGKPLENLIAVDIWEANAEA
jgi:hypothetical protein